MQNKQCKYVKYRPYALFAAGLFACVPCGVALVYYWRVIFEAPWLNTFAAHCGAVLFFAFLYCAVCAAFALLKQKFEIKAAVLIAVAAILFAFANPPMQTPDEHPHFLRANAIANGSFGYDKNETVSPDTDALVGTFTAFYNHFNPVARVGAQKTIADSFKDYAQKAQSADGDKVAASPIQQTVPYLPQAFGIFIVRLAGGDALRAMYGARVANALFYALMCYFALKNAKKLKGVLLAIMLLPLSLFMAGSCSSDAMLFGLTLLFISLFLKEEFTLRDLVPALVVFAVLAGTKLSYVLLLMLFFAYKPRQYKLRGGIFTPLLGACGAAAIFTFAMGLYIKYASSIGGLTTFVPEINIGEQIAFVMANPLRTAAVFGNVFIKNAGHVFEMGLFGWLDANINLVNWLSPIVLLLAAFLCVKQGARVTKQQAAVFALCAFASYLIIYAGLYATWTPVGMVTVVGLQARYFIHAFLMLLIAAVYVLNRLIFGRQTAAPQASGGQQQAQGASALRADNNVLLMCFAFAAVAALLLVQLYYVGI